MKSPFYHEIIVVEVQLHWYSYKFPMVFLKTLLVVVVFQEAPTNKLLYAKDIPTYKEEVKSYYKAIRDLPPLSSSEMEEFLTQESKVLLQSRKTVFGYFLKKKKKPLQNLSTRLYFFKKHENEFNEEVALTEIYKYIVKYFDEVRF